MSLLLSANLVFSTQLEAQNGELQRYIVKENEVFAYRGDKPIATLRAGQIIEISLVRAPWMLAPEWEGWVHNSQIIPLASAYEKLTTELSQVPAETGDPVLEEQQEIARERTRLLYVLGIVCLENDEPGKAIDCFEQARAAGLETSNLLINLGNAYQSQNELQKSLNCFTAAIEKAPESATAYENRAGVLSLLQQHQAALADSNRSLAIDPSRPQAYNNRGVTYIELEQHEKALTDFTRAIELKPDYIDAISNRAICFADLKRWSEAISDYQLLLKYDPNHRETLNDFAWLLATCVDEKFRDGKKAVQLATLANQLTAFEQPDYLDTLAEAQAEVGNFAEAVKIQTKLVEQQQEPTAEVRSRLKLYEQQKPFRQQ